MLRAYGLAGCKKNELLWSVRPLAHIILELIHHCGVEGCWEYSACLGSVDVGEVINVRQSRLARVLLLPGGVLSPLAGHHGSTKEMKIRGQRSSQFGTVATGRFGYHHKGYTDTLFTRDIIGYPW